MDKWLQLVACNLLGMRAAAECLAPRFSAAMSTGNVQRNAYFLHNKRNKMRSLLLLGTFWKPNAWLIKFTICNELDDSREVDSRLVLCVKYSNEHPPDTDLRQHSTPCCPTLISLLFLYSSRFPKLSLPFEILDQNFLCIFRFCISGYMYCTCEQHPYLYFPYHFKNN
jgi:hypothetical protein